MKKRSTRTMTNNKKKNGKRKGPMSNHRNSNKNNNNTSVEELLQAADTAMTTMDVPQAISLYSAAATKLRAGRGGASIDDTGTSISNVIFGASSSQEQQQRQLIQILEKLGEAQVSMGERDKAQELFEEGIQLLEQGSTAAAAAGEEDLEGATATTTTKDLYHYETRSNLYMYIGQLSSEDDALEAYKEGLASLEMCVQLVEEEIQQHPPHIEQIPVDTTMQDDDEGDDDDDDDMNGSPHHSPSPTTKVVLLQQLRRKLAGAYCTVAELFLTDLCFEDNAESDCEAYLQKALQLKDNDGQPVVDALQTMASLRLSQDPSRRREAVPYMLQAFDTMKKGTDALASLIGLLAAATTSTEEDATEKVNGNKESSPKQEDQALELKEVDAATNLPEFEFRTQTAKLLLECAALLREEQDDDEGGDAAAAAATRTKNSEDDLVVEQQCVMAAISVLGSLLAQNDEFGEIWYLTGCAFCAKRNPSVPDAARHYLQRAMEILLGIQQSLKQDLQFATDDDDDAQEELEMELENNASQIHDVQAKLDELPDDDDDNDEGGQEEPMAEGADHMEE